MAKIRLGFVSNSSSSSFIISGKTDKPKLVLSIVLDSIINFTATTKEELDRWFLEEYEYDTIEEFLKEQYYKEMYEKCLKAIEVGDKVHFGDVSSNDYDSIGSFIYQNGFSGETNFDVISGVR